jgi:hypothetical protein
MSCKDAGGSFTWGFGPAVCNPGALTTNPVCCFPDGSMLEYPDPNAAANKDGSIGDAGSAAD